MKNGDTKTFKGLKVEAVPAYNVVHMRSPGRPFHPKGSGNGYVITFGDTDTSQLVRLLRGVESVEIRVRKMK